MYTLEEKAELYDQATDFPGRGFLEDQAAHFWRICADHVENMSAGVLYARLAELYETYGKAANEAVYTVLGSDSLESLLQDYEETAEVSWKDLERDWKEDIIVADLPYLNRNYAGELEQLWEDECCWGFWNFIEFEEGGRNSQEALDAVFELLSGYLTYEELVSAC